MSGYTSAQHGSRLWVGDAQARRRVGGVQAAGWVGTAVPLATCVVVWGVGGASPAHMPWLSVVHDMVGLAASGWTVLQLVLKGVSLRARRSARMSWPRPGALAMYALLMLQPVLAITSSILHGGRAAVFGIPLPLVLPVNVPLALEIDRVHGFNALVLLVVIAGQIGAALLAVRDRRLG